MYNYICYNTVFKNKIPLNYLICQHKELFLKYQAFVTNVFVTNIIQNYIYNCSYLINTSNLEIQISFIYLLNTVFKHFTIIY